MAALQRRRRSQQAHETAPGQSLGDILRTVALVLLFGGVALALASFIVSRQI